MAEPPPRRGRLRLTRRGFILRLLAYGGVPAYGYWNTKWPRIERVTLRLPLLPREANGLRVVLLADTHVGRWRDGSAVAYAVRKANACEPDLALLLGDYCQDLNGRPQAAFDDAILPFAGLSAPYGIFAVPGNYDYWDGIAEVKLAFEKAAIPLLFNERRTVAIPGGLPPEVPRITLSHNPDRFLVNANEDFALMVSGHTHGGQVVIPFYGPILVPSDRRFAMGYHAAGDRQLYVTRGVGTVTPPVRYFCTPEITLMELRSPEA